MHINARNKNGKIINSINPNGVNNYSERGIEPGITAYWVVALPLTNSGRHLGLPVSAGDSAIYAQHLRLKKKKSPFLLIKILFN